MNRLITRSETELVILKKFPANKSPGPDGFIGEFYQTYKEEFIPILLKKDFKKIKDKGTLSNSFCKATITMIPKPDKDNTKKENYRSINITDEHGCKNPQQNFSKQNSATHQKANTPWSSWDYSSNARILQ